MRTSIHPTAVIDDRAKLHPTVKVEPYAVIGSQVSIGANTVVGSHAIIDGLTKIGRDNQIFPGAAIGLEPQDLKYKGANSQVIIGDRNRIREYVTINRATNEGEATVIGDDNLLMAYSHVGHNCIIGNEVIIANSVAIAGHVHVESMAIISGVLGIHQFVHIGRMAMVGGMSRISRDVPPYMMVEGNPAKVRSLNFTGLKRRGFSQAEIRQLKKAFSYLYLKNLPLQDAIAHLDEFPDSQHIQHLQEFMQYSIADGRRGLIAGK
ncbi:acyl-ACP--UDP-N-acetylglucosamine O-acyltransferase [Waterburya agarophytonicola K14]|uniref:Acyl-[acyl-carrier-protein]--UDP-N-acetylglucosamine O-acyltransferase n=1 Tax=Waterburya agarophytonicola KI4 TaxID=2874699 RepID=A0A964BR34_9CYAN|nr:acyl-ACP--UDP-N-acetylglucosamine O-acyltransferase [Waterburya agarophytonicola]MCC0176732.1 acyl-ACP--UDP-N-acetylglucosamine O-acyltransferase [Waterburya agarophytonicola KI4]